VSIYRNTIRSAFPAPLREKLTHEEISEIEDIMRHSIFHSTLDWQTREQLQTAAREAWEILKELRKGSTDVVSE